MHSNGSDAGRHENCNETTRVKALRFSPRSLSPLSLLSFTFSLSLSLCLAFSDFMIASIGLFPKYAV